jgi:hypothetical protein
MDLKSKSNSEEFLFLSVDVSFFRSNEVIFSFLPRHEQDARTFVANIVPYFRHKYQIEQIKDIFYHEAIARADQSVWNADTEEVVSPSDLYIDQSGEIMDDFDFLGVIGGEDTNHNSPNELEIKEISRVERLFTGEDSTSVGTLFTHDQQTPQNILRITPKPSSTITPSSVTRSVSTTLTIEDVEREMSNMSSELATIKTLITAVLEQQSKTNQTNEANNANTAPDEVQMQEAGDTETVICREP